MALTKRKVIIDQDAFGPGGSNLQSILLVLQAPELATDPLPPRFEAARMTLKQHEARVLLRP